MIDLRTKGLPDTIEVGSSFFKIKTDFREWIKFSEIIKDGKKTLRDLLFIFEDELTEDIDGVECIEALLDFYKNENLTPKSSQNSSEVLYDYVEDGEYIVGSFMKAYGIDLTSIDMHWHLFKALFISLPDDSYMKQIMGMRGYKRNTKSYEELAARNKEAWTLPDDRMSGKEKREILKEIDEEFYNS